MQKKSGKILFLVPQINLVTQAAAAFESNNLSVLRYAKGMDIAEDFNGVVVSTIQTWGDLEHASAKFSMIFVDEAHMHYDAQDKIFLAHNTVCIGLTATPIRSDERAFGALYDAIIRGPSPRDLIRAGHLADYKIYTGTAEPVTAYKNYANGLPTVVMCDSIEQANKTGQAFIDAGIPCIVVHSEHDDAAKALDLFRSGETRVLINVDMVLQGVDIPHTKCVIWLRATEQWRVWCQGNGRALRPHGESVAVIVDLAGNYARLMEKYDGIQLCDDVVFDLATGSISTPNKKNAPDAAYGLCASPICGRIYKAAPSCPYCGEAAVKRFKSAKNIKAESIALAQAEREGRERWIKLNRPNKKEQNKAIRACATVHQCIELHKTWGYANPGYARIRFNMSRGAMPTKIARQSKA